MNKITVNKHKIIMTVGHYPVSQKILSGIYLLARSFLKNNNPHYAEVFLNNNRINVFFKWEEIPNYFSSTNLMSDIQRACSRKPSFTKLYFSKKRNRMVFEIRFQTGENITIDDIYFVDYEEHFKSLKSYNKQRTPPKSNPN